MTVSIPDIDTRRVESKHNQPARLCQLSDMHTVVAGAAKILAAEVHALSTNDEYTDEIAAHMSE